MNNISVCQINKIYIILTIVMFKEGVMEIGMEEVVVATTEEGEEVEVVMVEVIHVVEAVEAMIMEVEVCSIII